MGILQARILEWVAMLSLRGSSQPRGQIQVYHIVSRFFTLRTTREAHVAMYFTLKAKESACQCRSLSFDPWIGKLP